MSVIALSAREFGVKDDEPVVRHESLACNADFNSN
jgi:hypothetical protein